MFGSKKRQNQKVLLSYKEVKSIDVDFERIALYFLNTDKADAHQILEDNILLDIDFEDLFLYLDRTCSRIGQQYLYLVLRTIPKNESRSSHFEKIIQYFIKHPEQKEEIVLQLNRLNDPGAYFLQQLIYGNNLIKPKWFWMVPVFSGISLVMLALSFLFPVLLLCFMPVLLVNAFLHYWNKKNILTYSNSIPQLNLLHQVASQMLNSGVISDNREQTQTSNDTIGTISKAANFFKWESKVSDELGQFIDYFLELIKMFLLLEPMLFFRLIRKIELIKPDIHQVFSAVAQVDVAISISSLRESLPYFCFPNISENKGLFRIEEIFHPLILNPIANSINVSDGKSLLISGSNMSGKTTFIRTIGINMILAQTINTACARELSAPRLKVHSAMRITDDLFDETSYYYEEVKTIKKMIDACESDHPNLFLLDEIFRGTNTIERISSGKAVLSYLNQEENIVVTSTHDLELTELLSHSYNYFHFTEIIENGLLVFDYELKDGILKNTNAIRILEINRYPAEITEEAKALAKQIREQRMKN